MCTILEFQMENKTEFNVLEMKISRILQFKHNFTYYENGILQKLA